MGKLEIKTEKLAQRCEVCHQSDCYYPKYDICTRCYKVSFGKMIFLKIKQHFQSTDRIIYTTKNALLFTTLVTLCGLIVGTISKVGFNVPPLYCSCLDSPEPYDIKTIPAILYSVTAFFPVGNFCGLVFWLIGLSKRNVKPTIFQEVSILFTTIAVSSLSLEVLGICLCVEEETLPHKIVRLLIGGLIIGFICWLISYLIRRNKVVIC